MIYPRGVHFIKEFMNNAYMFQMFDDWTIFDYDGMT